MPLKTELDAFLSSFTDRVPADVAQLIESGIAEQVVTGLAAQALQAGDRAPDLALPNARGDLVPLGSLWARGPVILTFYRGGWCPYCNLELRAYQAILPAIRAAGVALVAISPQTPDASLSTAERNALAFDVLSDVGSRAAEAFGIAFTLKQELRALYTRLGHPLPEANGTDDWRLPVPATFVIASGGRIVLAHVDADYRRRLEPADALLAAAPHARQAA
jgi:peroxiredoxin